MAGQSARRWRRWREKRVWVLAALLLMTHHAYALRCGNELVSRGDIKIEVLAKCGRPASVETWLDYRSLDRYDPYTGRLLYRRGPPLRMEEWVYNFGPQRLMQRLRFEEDKLIRIESLGYGF